MHFVLVDGSGFIFRAYHALPPLTRKKDGLPVGAVSGFCNMLYKLLQEGVGREAPTHFAVIFDTARKTFRNDIYPDYKANRPPPPEDLVPQFALVRDAVAAFSVFSLEREGFEADDIIATYAKKAEAEQHDVTIVSSDKDLMQLVSPSVYMYDAMKNRTLTLDSVKEKFGVSPDQVIDVQALAGDSVDNVPGVPGIGIKTAAELINTYGNLETLLSRLEEIRQPKRREKLMAHQQDALLSKKLVSLKTDIEALPSFEDLAVQDINIDKLTAFFESMELRQIKSRVLATRNRQNTGAEGSLNPSLKREALSPGQPHIKPQTQAGRIVPSKSLHSAHTATKDMEKLSASQDLTQKGNTVETPQYDCVQSKEELDLWIKRAYETGICAVDTETTSLNIIEAELVGISLSVGAGQACYIPLRHGGHDLMEQASPIQQIPRKEALSLLAPLLADRHILKIGQNIKYDMAILKKHGIEITPYDDTMLMSYVLEAGLHGHGMDELSRLHFDYTPIPFKAVVGTGKSQKTFDQVDIKTATRYAAEDADLTFRLWEVLKKQLPENQVMRVYEGLDRPLPPIIANMERAGIKVNPQILRKLSVQFSEKMALVEKQAHTLAGCAFNLGSPKQVGEILFETLGLPGGKKTRTGSWSTDAEKLEKLAIEGHELPRILLNWRGWAKLKTTYTDALIAAIRPETGRVHTAFSLAATSTGRFSSSDPNLQNIPIRTEEGRKIRTAFIAEPGQVLMAADYSQIELRILAHIADIPALKRAFKRGEDIHRLTASEMFETSLETVTPEDRRKAKAINFGIIYGISAAGLARNIGVTRERAAEFIAAYFEKFPEIKTYMEKSKFSAREQGYVKTIFGRKCHITGIRNANPMQRSFAERQAINAPIQGTAADIIRRAMIFLPEALQKVDLKAKMLLQVHDELVFELPEEEIEKTRKLVIHIMEQACLPVLDLSIPLIVEANTGRNWSEAHS